jgi:hypothetical protein
VPAAAFYLVILLATVVVVAFPVRRLRLDGHSRGTLIGYTILLLALALGVTELRPLARFLLPALGIAYIVPFITWPAGLDRLLGRRGPAVTVTRTEPRVIPPPRNVTPPPPGPADVPASDRTPGSVPPGPDDAP